MYWNKQLLPKGTCIIGRTLTLDVLKLPISNSGGAVNM